MAPIQQRQEHIHGSTGVAGLPWLSYVPVPGLSYVAVLAAPDDPLTRYHAWQGGILVVLSYVLLLVFGFLSRLSDAAGYLATLGLLSGLLLLAALVGIVWGMMAAARGRYARLRPVWDILAAAGR